MVFCCGRRNTISVLSCTYLSHALYLPKFDKTFPQGQLTTPSRYLEIFYGYGLSVFV